jgi:hypothetical protein
MHWRTYDRLLAKSLQAEARVDSFMHQKVLAMQAALDQEIDAELEAELSQ